MKSFRYLLKLKVVMQPSEALSKIRERAARQRERLPDYLTSLETQSGYPVRITSQIEELARRADESILRGKQF